MSETLQQVASEASYHLDEIRKMFKPSIKITLIARLPENDNADFVLSDDDIDEAIKALKRRKAKTPTK